MTRSLNDDIDTIATECLAVRIRLLNRVITGLYDHAMRGHGMTVGQMNILVVIGKAGPVRPVDVARVLAMDPSTLSRNLERMRDHGWVDVADDDDGRARLYSITAAGGHVIQRAMPGWRAAQERVRDLLGGAGERSLRRAASTASEQAL